MAGNLRACFRWHGRGAGEWAARRSSCTGCRHAALGSQCVGKLDQDLIETDHCVGQACRHSGLSKEQAGFGRFPVKVDELALEYSRQCFSDSPIDKVQGEDLDGFDGLLKANKSRSKWLVLYNSATPSEGRKRFTIAHEFGHYILHRHQQDLFECGNGDIETGDNNERDIEAEADLFASTLLMPLDDFRR